MKKIVLIVYLLCFGVINAQTISDYKKIQLGTTEIFALNSVSGTTFSLGGKSTRNRLAKKIPSLAEYILVQVRVDNEDAQLERANSQELLNNLKDAKLDATTKLAAGATIMSLRPPATGYKCDFFIFPDRNNFNGYVEQGILTNFADNWVSYPHPYRRKNTESFNLIIAVKDLQEKEHLFLGFRNNDNYNAIKVFVDVYAFLGTGWTSEIKAEIYNNVYEAMKNQGVTNEETLANTTNCFVTNLTSQINSEDFLALPKFQQDEFMEKIMLECNPKLKANENTEKALMYGNLGWKAFEKGDYEKCLTLSNKALELDNSLSYIYFNIALVYLIKNDSTTLDKYIHAIQLCKKEHNSSKSLQGALQDILDYETKNNLQIEGAEDIKYLLNSELGN